METDSIFVKKKDIISILLCRKMG